MSFLPTPSWSRLSSPLILLALLLSVVPCTAQSADPDSTNAFLKRIFLPSIDAGYQFNNSSVLGGSVKFATTIEYRIRNNNDFFLRLSYDTYGARYQLPAANSTFNTIEGTVQMTDVSLAPGYRMGDNTFRLMFSFMPGIKLYEFPTAEVINQQIEIRQEGKSIFTTTFLTTLEYYFDEKSALTLSAFQNQVWKRVDFWEDSGAAYGISLGFITSLI